MGPGTLPLNVQYRYVVPLAGSRTPTTSFASSSTLTVVAARSPTVGGTWAGSRTMSTTGPEFWAGEAAIAAMLWDCAAVWTGDVTKASRAKITNASERR